MAKQTTTCERCDGTFDGTPSGWLKHQQTDKHNKANPIPGDGVPDQIRATLALREVTEPVTSIEDREPEFTPAEPDELAEAEADEAVDPLPEAQPSPEAQPEPKAKAKVTKPRVYALSEAEKPEPEPDRRNVLAEEVAKLEVQLDERTDSLKLAEFRPFDFPPRAEALQSISAEVAELKAKAVTDVAKYKRYVRYGELHSPKNLPKYKQQLADAELGLSWAEGVEAAIKANDEARYGAHYERVSRYWNKVLTAADKAAGLTKATSEKVRIEVQASTFYLRFEGVDGLTVAGPHLRYEEGGEVRTPVGARVSWEGRADVESDAAAEFGLAVETLARLAFWIDVTIGLEDA